ncbi:hypothetical protein EDD22DRAFT_972924 [Suillus occidentalis]|nr:hypothetical protein EDD22DRAFT_972924 [Suillus occidentalis]
MLFILPLSPGMQEYLEDLTALYSVAAQAEGSCAAGLHVRRESIETVHPVVAKNVDFQVYFHWEPNSVAFWDNRIVTHTAAFDFWPQTRHALRATPHGEKPESVEEYERRMGKVAKERQMNRDSSIEEGFVSGTRTQ